MVTTQDMLYLENLVKVRLTDEKREKYRIEIGKVLDYVKDVMSIDLKDITPVHTRKNIFKSDEVQQDEQHIERALANAPDKLGNFYKVAQVIKQ